MSISAGLASAVFHPHRRRVHIERDLPMKDDYRDLTRRLIMTRP